MTISSGNTAQHKKERIVLKEAMESISKNREVCRFAPNYAVCRTGAEKSARRVWREAFGKGLPHSTSPGAYPTSFISSKVNALMVSHFRHEHRPGAAPLITSKPFTIGHGSIPLSGI
jgi:hypothetical protein